MIATFIPAAGASSRMGGRDKLLEEIGGEAILRRTARIALAADLGPVLVGLRPGDTARRAALGGLDLACFDVPDATDGMSATLRQGAKAALRIDGLTGLMILLPDMPDIAEGDLARLAHGFDGTTPVRAATEDGAPGHPTLFPSSMLPLFETLDGDAGAAALFRDHPPAMIALPGTRARSDLDTPEDWAAWRGDRE